MVERKEKDVGDTHDVLKWEDERKELLGCKDAV